MVIFDKCVVTSSQKQHYNHTDVLGNDRHESLRIKGYLNTCKGSNQSQFVVTKVKGRKQNYCVSPMSLRSHFQPGV